MGGQEGSRGYLIQAVIATFDSLKSDWSKVKIEPKTDEDKIDVVWLDDSEDIIEASQIKSSENNFGKQSSLGWITDMVKDAPNANKFKLSLIGNASGPVAKLFKDFSKIKLDDIGDKYEHLYNLRDKIAIELKPLDLDLLNDAIISNVMSFLNTKGVNVNYETNKLIAEGLIVQFLRFSTNGNFITKETFENKLLTWVRFNYEDQLDISVNQLDLKFYFSSSLFFTGELSESLTFPDIIDSDWIIEKKNKIEFLIKKITGIKLIRSKEPLSENNSSYLGTSFFSQANLIQERISSGDKLELNKLYQKVFNKILPDEVFDFGNLKVPQVKVVNVLGSSSKSNYKGNESEINRRILFDEFRFKLYDLNDILEYWEEMSTFRILPIVMENNGQEFNEDIDIQMKIPRNIPIVQSDSYPVLTRLNTLKEFNESKILNQILKHNKDSIVKEYVNRVPNPVNMSISGLEYMRDIEEKLNAEKNLFKSIVNHIFDFEIFYDDKDNITLEANIENIKPNEKISLPAYILITSNEPFEINYKINSRTLKGKINGKLVVK